LTKGYENVVGNLDNWLLRKIDAVESFCDMEAKKAERYGKINAKWIDRTGHARQGLTGIARWEGMWKLMIYMFHTVDYGVWLELCNDGKYAILEEAIDHIEIEFIAGIRRIMEMQ